KATRRNYIYRIRRRGYYSEFGKQREKNRFGALLISLFIRIAPKIGPLKVFKFKIPTPEAEKIFLESFDETILNYNNEIARISKGNIKLANRDWDTGKKTMQYEYRLADRTYSDWVIKLKENNFETITPSIKEDILTFYKNYSVDAAVDAAQWQQTTTALEELKMKK